MDGKNRLLLVVLVLVCGSLFAQSAGSLYDAVSPNVVYLRHEIFLDPERSSQVRLWQRMDEYWDGEFLSSFVPIATGSAFFVSDTGILLTNRHVVEQGDTEEIRRYGRIVLSEYIDATTGLSSSDREALKDDLETLLDSGSYRFVALVGSVMIGEVEILAVSDDEDLDLALIRLNTDAYGTVPLITADEERNLTVGSDVYSFGYPIGAELDEIFEERIVTMNRGNISGFRRNESLDIQHSASISPGNSGGPLVDENGRVVGINTAMIDSDEANNLFYAIGTGKIRAFLESEDYGWITLWNERLSRIDSAVRNSGLRTDSDGNFLSSIRVFVDIPDTAEIVLNGEPKGSGPRMIDLSLSGNSIEIRGEHGIVRYSLVVDRSISGTSVFTPALQSILRTVSVETRPPGAEIFADGRRLGVSPLEIELPPDNYRVNAVLDGHAFPIHELALNGENVVLEMNGVPGEPVEISGEAGAQIQQILFRSNHGTYLFPADRDLYLPQGTYTVTAEGSSVYDPEGIRFTVSAGNNVFDAQNLRLRGRFTVRGWNPASTLYIDGEPYTGDAGLGVDLPIGVHTIGIWMDDHQPFLARTLNIRPDTDNWVLWQERPYRTGVRSVGFWTGIALTLGGAAALTYAELEYRRMTEEAQSSHPITPPEDTDTVLMIAQSGITAVVVGAIIDIVEIVKIIRQARNRQAFAEVD